MSCVLYRSGLIEAARGTKLGREAAAHVAACASCRTFLTAQRSLSELQRRVASGISRVSLPDGLENELLAEFDAVRSINQRPKWYWMTAAGLALAASVVAGVLLVRAPWGLMGAPEPVVATRSPSVSAPNPARTEVAAVTIPPSPARPEPQKPTQKTVKLQQEAEPEEAFVSIPYTMPLAPYERANVVRMDVPVAALIAAGLPMRVRDVSANASADVLVGEDGRARAVRLLSVSDSTSYRSYK